MTRTVTKLKHCSVWILIRINLGDLHRTGASAVIVASTARAGRAWRARRGGWTRAWRTRAAGTRWAGSTWGPRAGTWAAAWGRARSGPEHVQKKHFRHLFQPDFVSKIHRISNILQGKLENKPAAAATSGSTAAFPYFLPSSLLVSILGTSLFFTSVFCFFLLLPFCGWWCPKVKDMQLLLWDHIRWGCNSIIFIVSQYFSA